MKRILCLLLVLCMMLPIVALADGEAKVGVAYGACHSHGIAVASVVVVDGVIVDAQIDEIYFTAADEKWTVLPNGEEIAVVDDVTTVAISKRANDAAYSARMVENGGQTVATSYDAIAAFVIGKTVAELEAAVEGFTADNKAEFVDVVSGSSLVDTLSYTLVLLDAAKNAQ